MILIKMKRLLKESLAETLEKRNEIRLSGIEKILSKEEG
jgi:hypothetical protein